MSEKNQAGDAEIKKCSFEGCGNNLAAKGFCHGHYRQSRLGLTLKPIQRFIRGPKCEVSGCDNPHDAKGFCRMHYQRVKTKGSPGPAHSLKIKYTGTCSVDACDKPQYAKLLCRNHHRLKLNNGDPLVRQNSSKSEVTRRDDTGRKQCKDCLKYKSESSYHKAKRTTDGLQNICKDCLEIRRKRRNYNIDFLEWAERQNWLCATCESAISVSSHVDHWHGCCSDGYSCGKCVRGILCRKCNWALGHAGDDSNRLRALADYLERVSN